MGVLGLIIIIAIISGGGKRTATSEGDSGNPEEMTLSEFQQISDGMYKSDVDKIVGSTGTLSGSSGEVEIYQYKGSGTLGANASVTFVNGKVNGKAQAGLE